MFLKGRSPFKMLICLNVACIFKNFLGDMSLQDSCIATLKKTHNCGDLFFILYLFSAFGTTLSESKGSSMLCKRYCME